MFVIVPKDKELKNMNFRSNSPPLEGGESLCEFYIEPSVNNEKLKLLQFSTLLENRENLTNLPTNVQDHIFQYEGDEKFPCKNFMSLFNKDLLPSNTFTQTFLQSILSSIDSSDPVVANAWMETLLDVIDLLPKEIIKGEILTLAVNKGQLSQPISSRLLCCKMLGKICVKFDQYIIIKEVLPVVLSLCQDVDFEVRGHMCRQLEVIAKGVGPDATKSAILPELVELANDEETFVRLAAIETVVQMLPILDDDTCKLAIIPLVKKFCENCLTSQDSTLPVISKQLGRLCHGLAAFFSLEQKHWFLQFFRDLAKLGFSQQQKKGSSYLNPMPDLLPKVEQNDRYRECRRACAYNFPAMVLFVGPENFEAELYVTFKELCSDPFQNVRQTMACGFSEVARLLKTNASLLHPELVLLLKDDSIEVLKGLIPSLPESLKAVYSTLGSQDEMETNEKMLVKALTACEEAISVTSSWRLHADFLSRLSCLSSCLPSETIFTTFVPLLFVTLHTARPIPCRTAAAYSLLIFLRNTPSLERRKGIINELIRELCYGRSCHKRMLFIRVCELVIDLFSKIFFKVHFFKPLLSLSVDPVPNIRLRLCAILPRLKGLMKLPKDSQLLQQLESCVKTLMVNEKDKDVSYAVSKAIEELDKIEVATESISRRSSCIEVALDMEDRFKETEEREQLEMEFSLKFLKEENRNLKSLVMLPGSPNKPGRIPIRKSGTLPKQSKDVQLLTTEKLLQSSPLKSIKIIKKERRISSPGLNFEFHRNSPKLMQPYKENLGTSKPTAASISSKCSIPVTSKPSGSTTNTWPRQKRVSCIPKQSLDRCPSPMPPPRRFTEQQKPEIKSMSKERPSCKLTLDALSKEKVTKPKNTQHSSLTSSVLESKRKGNTTPLPSPEVHRRHSMYNSISMESKIPTSHSKKSSKDK